jgi:anti-anti-sigma factor
MAKQSVLDVAIETAWPISVVRVSGSLDIATASQLGDAGRKAIALAGDAVIIDVSALAMCDSTGLGMLVRLHRDARAAGQDLSIRNPRRHVADLLAMTGINKVIPVRSSDP